MGKRSETTASAGGGPPVLRWPRVEPPAFKLGAGVDSVVTRSRICWTGSIRLERGARGAPDPPPFRSIRPRRSLRQMKPRSKRRAAVISPNSTGLRAYDSGGDARRPDRVMAYALGVKKIVTGTPTVDEQTPGTEDPRALVAGLQAGPRPLGGHS